MVKKLSQMGEENSSELIRKIDNNLMWLYRILPFTAIGIVRSSFGEILNQKRKTTLVDIGCGDGSALRNLNLPKNFEITGVDIFKPYLILAKKQRIYKYLIQANAIKFNPKIRYDFVIAAHILEHFNKEQGKKFLKTVESFAKRRVIIVAPIGEHPQEMYDHNIHQEHKSSWHIKDMKSLGYKVKVYGLKLLYKNDNVVQKYKLLSYVLFALSAISYPILKLKPELGTYMVCVKDK